MISGNNGPDAFGTVSNFAIQPDSLILGILIGASVILAIWGISALIKTWRAAPKDKEDKK